METGRFYMATLKHRELNGFEVVKRARKLYENQIIGKSQVRPLVEEEKVRLEQAALHLARVAVELKTWLSGHACDWCGEEGAQEVVAPELRGRLLLVRDEPDRQSLCAPCSKVVADCGRCGHLVPEDDITELGPKDADRDADALYVCPDCMFDLDIEEIEAI